MIEEEIKEGEEQKPLEVKLIEEPKVEKNPTSEDTQDEWDFNPSEEELKEMQDAQ